MQSIQCISTKSMEWDKVDSGGGRAKKDGCIGCYKYFSTNSVGDRISIFDVSALR